MTTLGVSVVALWIAVIVLGALVFALSRQIGVLHERVAPTGALTLGGGLKAGESLPDLSLPTLTGQTLRGREFAARERGVLFFFLSPTCPICKSLLPVVRRMADEENPWLDVVLASDGDNPDEHRALVEDEALTAFPYVLSRELGLVIGVSKLPYAALVDEAGVLVAHGLVNSREHLESLFEARRLNVSSINEYVADQRRD